MRGHRVVDRSGPVADARPETWRRRFGLALVVAAALFITACGDSDADSTFDLPPIELPSQTGQDWLALLPPPPSYSTLSDDRISDLLAALRTRANTDRSEPPILIPHFSADTSGLFDQQPSDVLQRIFSLYDEAGSREGVAVTAAEAECLLDLNGDGECDQLEVKFTCPRCADTDEVAPLLLDLSDNAAPVPILEGYAERLARDMDDQTIVFLNDSADELTRRALQRVGQSSQFGVVDDIVTKLPTLPRGRPVCFKIPKGPHVCLPS